MLNKIIGALSLIFSKALVTRLLPELIKAEKTKQPGPEKKKIAVNSITIIINQSPKEFSCDDMNPSVPWPDVLPILIDAMIKILNLFFGHLWGKSVEANQLLEPPGSNETPPPR